MKISIITLHSILNNYGSVLQGFALCRFLNNNGYNAEVIDYRPDYPTNMNTKIRKLIINTLFLPYYISRTRKFRDFIIKNNNLSKQEYRSYEELLKSPPKSDVFIAGSDQIWNSFFLCGNDPAYFLRFVNTGKKMSYAASLGRDDIGPVELKKIKDNIDDFDHISVREQSGKEQLEKVGVKNVERVLDPVFLLKKEDYIKLGSSVRHEKYLLVYAVEQDDLLTSTVNKISNELNLKVISIGGFSNKCKCDMFDRAAGPDDFISLINNAEYVVTSSFHCAAFSLIFNKNFSVVLPKKNPTRLENIMSIVGLEKRIVKTAESITTVFESIDYTEPNSKLKIYIDISKKFLFKALDS